MLIEKLPDLRGILVNLILRRPIRRLVIWQTAANWIDTKGEETVEFRMEAPQAKDSVAEQIPVKRFEVTYIEDDAMTLGDGTVIKVVRFDKVEEFVGTLACIRQA